MGINLSKLQVIVEDRGAWHAAVHGVTKSWTRLRDWTTTESLSLIQKKELSFLLCKSNFLMFTLKQEKAIYEYSLHHLIFKNNCIDLTCHWSLIKKIIKWASMFVCLWKSEQWGWEIWIKSFSIDWFQFCCLFTFVFAVNLYIHHQKCIFNNFTCWVKDFRKMY